MNNENMILWIGGGIALVFILLIVYLYLKDYESARKARRYENSIEDLNKEIYRLQKKFKEQENDLEKFKQSFKQQIYQETRLEMKNLIDSNL